MSDIDGLLRLDPLAAAEGITGRSYKEDDDTLHLGMALALTHGAAKRAALAAIRDTHYGVDYADALSILASLGFEIIHKHSFPSSRQDTESDVFSVLWSASDGVLVTAESYGTHLNGGRAYYNWVPTDWAACFDYTSSGGVHTPYERRDPRGDDKTLWTWVGDHDIREGFRHNLTVMRSSGRFLPAWVERPFLWLLDYAQSSVPGYDHEAVTEQLVAILPASVQVAITPAVAASAT